MSKGYESLMKKVKKDCIGGSNCFNPNGCDKNENKCFHRYCDKFKWIIDRAKHYAEKTGLNWEEILDKWEESCDYWYMNYYQEAKWYKIANIGCLLLLLLQIFIYYRL